MANNDHDDIRALFNVPKEAAAVVDASVNSNPRIGSYQHEHVSMLASSSFLTKPLQNIPMWRFVTIALFLVGMSSLLWDQQRKSQHPWCHAQESAALYEYIPQPRAFLRPRTETTTEKHEHHRSLLLLRHAKSSRDDPATAGSGTHLDDLDRPLAPEGQLAALQLADYVSHHSVPPPDVIYVSPSIRTLATLALIRSQGWAMQNVPMILDQRLYDFFEEDEDVENNNSYLEYLRNLDDDTKNYRRIMIVGHNPPIGALAHRLVVQDESAAIGKFSPGSLCDIHWNRLKNWANVEDGTGQLALFVRPRQKV